MAINSYVKNGKKFYEVYLQGLDSGGRRFQKRRAGIDTIRKAETVEFELKRQMAIRREQKVAVRWGEWLETCLERMKLDSKPSTVLNYRGTLNKWATPHWENRDLISISKAEIYEVVFEKNTLVSANSQKCLLKFIKRIFQRAVEEGHLDRNPCIGITIKVPEIVQKVLTSAEVNVLLTEAKRTNHRFYPIWTMALMTGMRSGELFALRWTDIDLHAKRIAVTKQWTSKNGFGPTKTRLNRVVPISEELVKFLKELKLQRAGDEFVLPHANGWEKGEQARITKEFCHAVGITEVKFHDLRATFITNLLSRGESLARVMSIVGHNDLKTTNGYLRKAGVDVQGGTDKLGYTAPEIPAGDLIHFTKGV